MSAKLQKEFDICKFNLHFSIFQGIMESRARPKNHDVGGECKNVDVDENEERGACRV